MSYKPFLKIFFFILGLFLIYNIILFVAPVHRENFYDSKERAEEYIYSKKHYQVVFVGSGLIGDFSRDSFKRDDFFNLYFPYSGSCTGVEVIVKSQKIPDTLFVETNYISKGFNTVLINKLFKGGWYKAKFYLPSLQEKNKPVSFLKQKLNIGYSGRILKTTQFKEPEYSASIEKIKVEYNELPEQMQFVHDLQKLKKYLDVLSEKGCVIFLFETPIEQSLTNTPKMVYERKIIQSVLTSKKFLWIAQNTTKNYATVDGIHLLEKSVGEYLRYVDSQIVILKKPLVKTSFKTHSL